jgi:hexosaminidase
LSKDVIKEINQLFSSSPYIHLGGDEVSPDCWDLRPDIKTFMATKNITDYGELQMYWRSQIKSVLPPNRKFIFWRNDGTDVTTLNTDILHYWGNQNDTASGNLPII